MNLIKQIVKPGEYGIQTIKMIVRSNERGPQGEQGEKGTAATITAGQAYSVPANVGPQVMNVGTSSNAVFDFYIPRGETEWSDITGNIHDQADLEPYLEKADTALQPDDINYTVMQDLSVSANGSTSVLQLDADKVNLKSGATTTKNIPLTVASHDKAGVMNSATFDAIANNSAAVETILSGMVAINGLSASPSQSGLTTAWETATGRTELINRAQILDVDNSKYWTYYTNTELWYPATADIEGSVSTFTNSTEGVIKGSTTVGQVYAESNGTGSVNGWDTLSAQVADNTANKLGTAKLTANGGITKTTTGSGANTAVNMAITDGGVTTAKIADGNITTAKFTQYAVNVGIKTATNLSPAEDTPTGWRNLLNKSGMFVTRYNTLSQFANQPSQYGELVTINNGTDVIQYWLRYDQPAQCRYGTVNGWKNGAQDGSWSLSVDDYNIGTYAPMILASSHNSTAIPANANLNTTTYCQPGNYRCASNSTVATLSNCPTANAFRMFVFNMTSANTSVSPQTGIYRYMLRIITDYLGNTYVQAVYNNGTDSWTFNPSSWKRALDNSQTNIITTNMLQDSAVTTAKINNGAVTADKIASAAIYESKIVDGVVTTAKLASNAVTTTKIKDLNVTTDKIANKGVTAAKIADATITSTQLASNAVTTAKILGLAVTADKLASSAVTTAKIASAAVTGPKIDWTTLGYAYKVTSGTQVSPTSGTTWYYPSGWDFSFTAVSGGVYEIECSSAAFGINSNVDASKAAGLSITLVSGATSLADCLASSNGQVKATQTARRIVQATSTTVKVKAGVQGSASTQINVGPGLFIVRRVA